MHTVTLKSGFRDISCRAINKHIKASNKTRQPQTHQHPIITPRLLPPNLLTIRKNQQPALIRAQRIIIHMQGLIVSGWYQQIRRHICLRRSSGHIVPHQVSRRYVRRFFFLFFGLEIHTAAGGGGGGRVTWSTGVGFEKGGVAAPAVPPSRLREGFRAKVFAHKNGVNRES